MERNSFVFYDSFYKAISKLQSEEQSLCLKALCDYCFKGVVPDNDNPIVSMFFELVKPQIDTNNKRYENGCKGGRPSKSKETKPKPKQNQKKPNNNQTETKAKPKETKAKPNDNVNVNDNVNDNENDNVNNKDIIGQPKQPVAIVPKKAPQQRIFDYFANRYKTLTGFKYKYQISDFVNLAKLLKDYKEEEIIQKIKWLEVGCKNRVFWFAKTNGINSFTVGKLFSQWNEILPQYTAEQLKAQEEQKKEEEQERRVQEELAKDELSKGGCNGCNN